MSEKPCHGWTLMTLKEHYDALRLAEAGALKIQAIEYERRLDALNGEQARIAKSQSTYVSRELWDAFKTQVDTFMAAHTGRTQMLTIMFAVVVLIAAVATAIATVLALK